MDSQKEQLLHEIGELSINMQKASELSTTISKLESENAGLRQELEHLPTEQTTHYDNAKEEVYEKARIQDSNLGKKLNKLFLGALAGLTIMNAVLLLTMMDKASVVGKMQAMNMKFPNYTTEEVMGVILPLMIILAVIFQVAAIIGAMYIAKNIDIGDRQIGY